VGLNDREFVILKFRTMKNSAGNIYPPAWVDACDQDMTSLQKFLRRFNLDELPQLINVLRGEMSLVGPRPEQPYWVETFKQQIPNYHLRHRLNAGITGWAQINGWRGATSIYKRTEHDLYYLRHWSFWLDFKILLLTLTRGFRQRKNTSAHYNSSPFCQ
jgi:putative colanic acid biosynthesis UDP-glucose lipid carrier transferase